MFSLLAWKLLEGCVDQSQVTLVSYATQAPRNLIRRSEIIVQIESKSGNGFFDYFTLVSNAG